jgi:hypothetical protein
MAIFPSEMWINWEDMMAILLLKIWITGKI